MYDSFLAGLNHHRPPGAGVSLNVEAVLVSTPFAPLRMPSRVVFVDALFKSPAGIFKSPAGMQTDMDRFSPNLESSKQLGFSNVRPAAARNRRPGFMIHGKDCVLSLAVGMGQSLFKLRRP